MRMRRLVTLACIGLALSACSAAEDYLNSINPFQKRDPPLPGERHAVLSADPTLQAPAPGQGRPLVIGPQLASQDWTNPGGPPSNAPGNVAIAGTGQQVWRVAGTGSETRLSVSPIVAGGRVIVYDNRRVSTYALANGGASWSVDTIEGSDSPVPGGGIASDGRRVYVATGLRRLMALDIDTGQQVWSQTLTEPARGAPTVSGGIVYFVSAQNIIYAVSAADGKELWRYSGIPETGGLLSSSSPAVSGNLVVVPFTSGELVAFDAQKGGSKWSGSLARAIRTTSVSSLSDVAGRPVIDRGLVVAGSVAGRLVAVKDTTGERVWERNIATAYTPASSGDGVFIVSVQGDLYGLDRTNGSVRWVTKLPGGEGRVVWAGPTLAGNTLWAVSNRGHLVGVNPTNGQVTVQREIGEGSILSPIAAGGRLIVATTNGGLAAFD